MLAGAVYPALVVTVLLVWSGGFDNNLLMAMLPLFIYGGIGSFFGFLYAGIFGSLSLLLTMVIARAVELPEDRTWIAVFAGGLAGLCCTGFLFLLLLTDHPGMEERLRTYFFVATATVMGQVGAWLGVRRAINAASRCQSKQSGTKLPRFRLHQVFWFTAGTAIALGTLKFFKLPLEELMRIATHWTFFQACTMGAILALDRWIPQRNETSEERST